MERRTRLGGEEAVGRRGGRDWEERRRRLGGEEQKCSAISRGDTRPDLLRHRLEDLTKELGGVERFEREKLQVRDNGI